MILIARAPSLPLEVEEAIGGMQHERRRDPYPWSWEIPAVIGLTVAMVVLLGIQVGRSVANMVAGAGWTWPAADTGLVSSPFGSAFWSSLPGVLSGDSQAGLPEPAPTGLAGPALLWIGLGLAEVLFLTLTVWAGLRFYLRWGPGRMRGMASAGEAENLLGVTRLRKVAALVRPDLHSKHGEQVAVVHRLDDYQEIGELQASQIGRGLSSPWLRRPNRGDRGGPTDGKPRDESAI